LKFWRIDLDSSDFALNCGARSCPALRQYDLYNIDSTLDFAAETFIEDDVEIDMVKKQVFLT
jgi:hypothetical protein